MLNKQPDRYEVLLRASENLLNKTEKNEQLIDHTVRRVDYLEDHMVMNSRKALNIKSFATKHVTALLGGYGTENYKENFRKVIRKLWHDYWNAFGITSYRDTPAKLYDTALDWIKNWRYIHDSEDEE